MGFLGLGSLSHAGGPPVQGPPPPPISSQPGLGPGADFSGLSSFGTILSISGMLTGAIGSFYAAKSQQYELRSQQLSLEYQQNIANLNARLAEADARAIIEAGHHAVGLSTLRAGQIEAANRAATAARGVQAGVGSAAEVQASLAFARESDAITIDANAARQAAQARLRAVDLSNRGLLAGVSASNIRRTASGISPGLAGFTSLLSGTSRIAGQQARSRRLQSLFGGS